MKILFVNNLLYRYGPPVTLFRLIEQLKKTDDHEIALLSYLDGPLRGDYEKLGLSPIIDNLYEINTENIKQLARISKELQADLIVANTLDGINGCFAASQAGIPVALYLHEDAPQINTSLLHLFAVKVCDLVLLTSAYQQKLYQPLLTGLPTRIIPPGIPFERFSPTAFRAGFKEQNGLPTDTKIVTIIGTVCERKRQDLFVLAANEVLKQRQDIVFLIIGRLHPERKFDQLILQAGKAVPQIRVLDEKEGIEKFLQISDLLVSCSGNDVSPAVILEAQAMGKPVVAVAASNIPDIIGKEHNGILLDNNDPQPLAAAILKALADPDPYRRSSAGDLASLRAKYDVTAVSRLFSRTINKLKPRKKYYSVRATRSGLELKASRGIDLHYKNIVPAVTRKRATFKKSP